MALITSPCPFSQTKEFCQRALKQCPQSKALKDTLANWDSLDRTARGTTLVIELLAHQFAMPVRWIETQALMFGSIGVRRCVIS